MDAKLVVNLDVMGDLLAVGLVGWMADWMAEWMADQRAEWMVHQKVATKVATTVALLVVKWKLSMASRLESTLVWVGVGTSVALKAA